MTEAEASALADRYWQLPEEVRDKIADRYCDVIYFCVECDERCLHDYTKCRRFPAKHDETGYMGTGTDYPPEIRRLARMIAND